MPANLGYPILSTGWLYIVMYAWVNWNDRKIIRHASKHDDDDNDEIIPKARVLINGLSILIRFKNIPYHFVIIGNIIWWLFIFFGYK